MFGSRHGITKSDVDSSSDSESNSSSSGSESVNSDSVSESSVESFSNLAAVLEKRGMVMRDFDEASLIVYTTELARILKADNEEAAFRVARSIGFGDLDAIHLGITAMAELAMHPAFWLLSKEDRVIRLARHMSKKIGSAEPGPAEFAVALPLAWYSRTKHQQYDVAKLIDLTNPVKKTKRISDVLYILPPDLAQLAFNGKFEKAMEKQAKRVSRGEYEAEIGFTLTYENFESRLKELPDEILQKAIHQEQKLVKDMKRDNPMFVSGCGIRPIIPCESLQKLTFNSLFYSSAEEHEKEEESEQHSDDDDGDDDDGDGDNDTDDEDEYEEDGCVDDQEGDEEVEEAGGLDEKLEKDDLKEVASNVTEEANNVKKIEKIENKTNVELVD